jgi:hypothetical protein
MNPKFRTSVLLAAGAALAFAAPSLAVTAKAAPAASTAPAPAPAATAKVATAPATTAKVAPAPATTAKVAPAKAAPAASTAPASASPATTAPAATAPATRASVGTTASKPRPTVAHAIARPAKAPAAPAPVVGADSSRTRAEVLKGDTEGTVFRSLTVEGEDRVHVDVDRPDLQLDLDPAQAPGLVVGDARDVLGREAPDLDRPLLALVARTPDERLGKPWLDAFASGPVVRFHPDVEDVERWNLTVADSKGQAVARFSGHGRPPREISWDGRLANGGLASPGLTYSFVLEAFDKAGNKRNFVGDGFKIASLRVETPAGPMLTFAGRALQPASSGRGGATRPDPLLLEAASWLDQDEQVGRPLRVTVVARSAEQAGAIAATVIRGVTPHLLGDPARLQPVTRVEPDAPEGGVVTIGAATSPVR